MDIKNLPQSTIAAYVSGAKDMENRLYILKSSVPNLENKKSELKNKLTKENEKIKAELEAELEAKRSDLEAKRTNLEALKKKKKGALFDITPIGILLCIILYMIFGLIIGIPIGFIIKWIFSLEYLCVIITVSIITVLLWMLIPSILKDTKEQLPEIEKEIEKETNEIACMEKSIPDEVVYEDVVPESIVKLNHAISEIETLITDTNSSITQISKDLNEYYQANIIPPDYRNAGCVELIDYVFRNDQADTMREATLLCNQYQWHGDLMKTLHSLGQIMVGINNSINHLNTGLTSLRDDIDSFANGQTTLANETKLARYAAESTAKSMDYLEWRLRLNS